MTSLFIVDVEAENAAEDRAEQVRLAWHLNYDQYEEHCDQEHVDEVRLWAHLQAACRNSLATSLALIRHPDWQAISLATGLSQAQAKAIRKTRTVILNNLD